MNLIAIDDDVRNRQVTSPGADHMAQTDIRFSTVSLPILIVGIKQAHPASSSSTAIYIEVVAEHSHEHFVYTVAPAVFDSACILHQSPQGAGCFCVNDHLMMLMLQV